MPIVMCIEVERQNAKYDKRCEDDLAHTAAMILEERTQSDAKTPRTPKALRAKINADTSSFCASFCNSTRPRVAFGTRANLLSMTSAIFIDFTIRIANGDSMPDKCAARL
jgi:hypothetical protein